MNYKHYFGPVKDTGYVPYYPQTVRNKNSRSKDKLLDGEVEPDEVMTKREALDYLIFRETRYTDRHKPNREPTSGGGLSLK